MTILARRVVFACIFNALCAAASNGNPTKPWPGPSSFRRLGQTSRFVRAFGHPTQADYGLSLVLLSDGYLVAGNTFGYGAGTFDGFFAKFDFDANLIWSKAYGTDLAQLFYHLLQTQDGGFLAVGLVIHPRPDGGTPCLAVRTDADGELLWSKEYWVTDGCRSAVETDDGGFALTSSGETPSGARNVFLIRLDEHGNQLWAKSFGGEVKETPYSLVQTSDGGFLIAGDSDSFFPRFGPYIVKTSSSGDLRWSRTIRLVEPFQYEGSATWLKEVGAGEFVVSGWVVVPELKGLVANGFFLQFNDAGQMRWFRRFESTGSDNAIFSFDLTGDGQVIALAAAPLLSVFAIDSSGQVLWSNRLATLAAGNQIRVEADGSSVVTGYAPGESSSQPDALLLKVDAAGQTGCDTSLQLQVLEESPQFDSPPTVEQSLSVTVRDYPLRINGAMKGTREICAP
jgi:hypothetical protein